MSALPPFDPDACCPKCGHDDINTHYKADAHCVNRSCPGSVLNRTDLRRHPVPKMDDCCNPAKAEHQERTCRRCHFSWAELARPGDPDA